MSMEIPFMDHVRHSLMIDKNKDVIIDKLLNLTLEIICLLTGEDYVVVRRSADLCVSEQRGRHVSDGCSEVQGLISGDSSPSPPLTEDNPPPRIPEPGRNLHRDTQKLPIKSEEAEVCVWDHSADQRGAVEVGAPELRSAAAHREGSPPRKCRTPECSQGQAPPSGDRTFHQCKEEEDSAVPGDVGAGGDDITHHQDQCLEDFIEEDSEMTAQEYQHPIKSEEAEVCVWDHSADQRGAAEVGAPELRSAEGPFICVAASSHVTNVTNQDRTFHQCKEEEDSAVPGDVGAGGDDITHHQDQCLEDFIEEESETTAQEYQHSIKSEEAEVCVWDHSADQRGAAEVGAPELRSAEGPFICVAASSHVTNVTNQDRTFHQCKEEEDSAVPGDVGAGGDDITHHQDQCLEDFIEEDSEMTAQEYQPDVRDGTLHLPCKEEAAPDYMTSGSAISSLSHCSQDHFPRPPDPAVHPKSPSTNNPFSCSICGVRFASETTYADHRRYHAEERTYSCTFCGKSFNQRSRLLSHKRKHTGEKPFSCPVCGRCFAERSALVAHQRIHSGEKPFNCTECARSFVQRSSLVKHQRIHTGEQPFVCSQCGRRFSQSSNLVRHQRILHHFI
ncbi:uncharacterized protein [Engystomops pustulosus]|uniref:uncharacterized protein isoform X4 n=1 Tax=Engystomops pustulosus TaxID=76066 RepID=UPI003AFAE020